MAELAVIEGGNEPKKGSKRWSTQTRKRGRQLSADLDLGYMELARILYDVYDTPMDGDPAKGPIYKSWGFRSFVHWAEEDLSLDKRTAQRLRKIWYSLEYQLVGLDPVVRDRIVALGVSKVRELVRVLTVENAEEWVSLAEKVSNPVLVASVAKAKSLQTETELAEKVAERQAAEAAREEEEEEDDGEAEVEAVGGGAHVPDAAPDFDGVGGVRVVKPVSSFDEPEELTFERFSFYPEQHLNVKLALRKSSELSGSDKKSHNLDLICTDFLANNDIIPNNVVENRVRFMRRMEQVFGVKIIALDTANDEVVYGVGTLSKLAKGS